MNDVPNPDSSTTEAVRTTEVPIIKKKFWTSDKILSLSAMFMSACTLLVLIYQTNLMRKQQYLSVYPYLQLMNYGVPTYNFTLTNNGVGPALIKAVRVHYQGEVYETDLASYLLRTISPKDSIDFTHSNIFKGQLIPPNMPIPIVQLVGEDKVGEGKLRKLINDDKLDFEIEYASIYGERWVFSKKNTIPRKLD